MPTNTEAPERIWLVQQTSDGWCKQIWFPERLRLSEGEKAVEYIRAPAPLAEDRVEAEKLMRAQFPNDWMDQPNLTNAITTLIARIRAEQKEADGLKCDAIADDAQDEIGAPETFWKIWRSSAARDCGKSIRREGK